MALLDDFQTGAPGAVWASIGNGNVRSDNSGEFVLAYQAGGTRAATTTPLDLSAGGEVLFDLLIGIDTTTPWGFFEQVDGGAEQIILQYSANGGAFTTFAQFPQGTPGTGGQFGAVTATLPDAARTTSTVLRFTQLQNSGASFDHWAIDNVVFEPDESTQIDAASLSQSILEGDAGGTIVQFTVIRNHSLDQSMTVDFTIAGAGSFPADSADFVVDPFPGGVLTFAPMEDTQTISVEIAGDVDAEGDEQFTVTLSNPSLGGLSGGAATVTIENDDDRIGSTDADVLIGGDFDETIDALAGDDRVEARGGDDIVFGREGDDTLLGEAGDDMLDGGLGADVLSGGDGLDQLSGGDGDDELDGGVGFDRLNGEAGDDELRGGSEDDVLSGGDGIDQLFGEGGNDQLTGGEGADVLDGGDGVDLASYADDVAGLTVDLGSGVGPGGDTLIGIEQVRGGAGDDVIIGGLAQETFYGGDGDDQLSGGAGGDRLVGQAGGDILSGGDGRDVIEGGDGDDDLTGGEGRDILTGGDGVDVARYEASAVRMDVRLYANAASDGDTLFQVENVVGSAFNDYIAGDSHANQLSGGAGDDQLRGGRDDDALLGEDGDDMLLGSDGDDMLTGGAGADRIDGGAGVDWARYDVAGGPVDVRLYTNQGSDGDVLRDVENLLGSAFDDVLAGNFANNRLVGGAGDDILDGDAFDDVLIGGAGADMLIGGPGLDLASYEDETAGIDVRLYLGTGPGGDVLDGIEQVRGGAGDDFIVGNTGQETFFGGDGNDQLRGGSGGDRLVGEAGDDILLGQDGRDMLEGGDGDDDLTGGEGRDILIGGAGVDVARYDLSAVRIDVRIYDNQASDGDRLILVENVVGTDFNDYLAGDSHANVLRGRGGADQLRGGSANDILIGGAGGDILFGQDGDDMLTGGDGADLIDGGAGEDWARYDDAAGSIEVRLFANEASDGDFLRDIENVAGGAFDDLLSGNSLANRIIGGGGNDQLRGGSAEDILIGGTGADVILGQAGNDRLFGEAGMDVFVHAPGDGVDRAEDFATNGDLLNLAAHNIADFAAFQALTTDTAEGALVQIDATNAVLLVGVTEAEIGQEDVLL